MLNKRKSIAIAICSLILIIAILLLTSVAFVMGFSRKNIDYSFDEALFSLERGSSITEYYYNSAVSGDYEPQLYATSNIADERKRWIGLNSISDYLKSGFIAVEDRSFYSHKGVDIKRTAKAMLNSVFHFDKTFGASTITQQVIKNMSGDNEVTLRRKFTEILRAVNLEKNHTKDEILEVYLNLVPMGENICGVEMASNVYFGKSAGELSAAESAVLIGITNAPTRFNPHKNPEACLKKRNDILYIMKECDIITEEEYGIYKNEELNVLSQASVEEAVDNWFVETVNKDVVDALVNEKGLSREYAEALVTGGGLRIYTTVEPNVQAKLEEYFSDKSNFPSDVGLGLDFAMSICSSEGGDLIGIVGSVGKKDGNRLLNMATAPHTPGSALKPIALYAPLINDKRINYATVFDDVPLSFNKEGESYIEYPRNYPAVYDGLTTVKDALRTSKNTIAIRLYNMLGAENIYRSLKKDFGIEGLVRREIKADGQIVTDLASAPLALGQLSYGISLRALTESYTVFPNEGKLGNSRSFVAVYDNRGNLLIENNKTEKQIYRKEAAMIMNKLLMNVTENGTARSVTLKNIVDTAGKTGTSGDDKDRLFIGYTPYYTAGIWCGYRDGTGVIGKIAPTHLKIWNDIMLDLHKHSLKGLNDTEIKSFSQDGLRKLPFCKDSGRLYSPQCSYDPRGSRMDYGYFEPSNAPFGSCERHIVCLYDALTEGVATHNCPEEYLKPVSLLVIDDRHFKKEITVTDAEYVYKKMDRDTPLGDSYDVPYFVYLIEDGDHVGRGRRKKQFNSACFLHDG